ncbi:MAG TPA: 2-dehydro-3-deoxy-6-phosphogalactonate aldolase [Gammaproteobacteria bacterium]|nr:2-dehydro-3-deoxy-6-phosphogalactonate aldolase [Gammaproteobacteria bacterium]
MADTPAHARFETALRALPLIAIVRGIKPSEAEPVALALHGAGFRLIEVPLNSPDPFDSIARMRRALPADTLVGAGTVLRTDDVQRIKSAGGELVVMPHGDVAVIRAAKNAGLVCVPGAMTPTEAFAALDAGADALKLFPAELISPRIVKALRAVLPKAAYLFAVGGVTPDTMADYVRAGATGFGLGSALYGPGASADLVGANARRFAEAWRVIATA